jgi:LysM repeat protein
MASRPFRRVTNDFEEHVKRTTSVLLATFLVGCAAADVGPPPIGPVSAAEVGDTVPVVAEPVVEPVSLEERWAAPFAVEARGSTRPRESRVAVVVPPGPSVNAPSERRAAEPRPEEPAAPTAEAPAPADELDRPTPRPPAAAPRPRAPTHRVVQGETFFGIARRYEVTTADLAAANPGLDPGLLRAGQVLRIPAPDGAAEFAPGARIHRVSSGETLFGISRRYGVPPERIRRVNRLEDDRVRIGQTLIIPPAD